MIKTVFFGNSDFVMPTLKILHEYTSIQAIVTGGDKIITKRKKEWVKPSPKIFAEQHQILCYQPSTLKSSEFIENYNHLDFDLGVIISYGKILPDYIFSKPQLGILNLHSSILPNYRGASPIYSSLLNGDAKTGVSLQRINAKIDEGNVLLIEKITISEDEVYPELKARLSQLAAETLKKALLQYQETKTLPEEKQQIGEPSFCAKIEKSQAMVSFQKQTAQEIYNQFRAFFDWPQTHFLFQGKLIKLLKLKMVFTNEGLSGEVLKADKDQLIVKCFENALLIEELQPENKKKLDFASFLNGYQIRKGDRLA